MKSKAKGELNEVLDNAIQEIEKVKNSVRVGGDEYYTLYNAIAKIKRAKVLIGKAIIIKPETIAQEWEIERTVNRISRHDFTPNFYENDQ